MLARSRLTLRPAVDYQFAFFFRKTDSRHVVLLKVGETRGFETPNRKLIDLDLPLLETRIPHAKAQPLEQGRQGDQIGHARPQIPEQA